MIDVLLALWLGALTGLMVRRGFFGTPVPLVPSAPPIPLPTPLQVPGQSVTLLLYDVDGELLHEIHLSHTKEPPQTYQYGDRHFDIMSFSRIERQGNYVERT